MKCPECGSENPEGSKFCGECGAQLPTEFEAESKVESKEPKPEPKKADKTPVFGGISNKALLLILVGVFAVIGAIAIYFYYPGIFISATPQNSTVFIDPAVSGKAEVIDPTDNKTYTVAVDYYSLGGGSGFIVSRDGYIVTAAHVVSDPWELAYNGKIKKMDDDDIKWYVDRAAVEWLLQTYHPDEYSSMTGADLDDMTDTFIKAGAVRATDYQYDIYIRGPAFPDSVDDPPLARIVDSGDSNNEIDVALLKVDNVGGLPAIPLSSQKIETGDQVRIYGYPAEQFAFYNEMGGIGEKKEVWKSIYIPTLTTGIVSGERPSPKGVKYYQTDAATDKGSSGGPVCNTNNQVIGIIVEGFVERTQGFNFFMPSEYIIEMCKKNGVNL